jgi:hypothetical protein
MATKKTTTKKASPKSKAKKPATKKKPAKATAPKQATAEVKQEPKVEEVVAQLPKFAPVSSLPPAQPKKKKSLWRRIVGFGF